MLKKKGGIHSKVGVSEVLLPGMQLMTVPMRTMGPTRRRNWRIADQRARVTWVHARACSRCARPQYCARAQAFARACARVRARIVCSLADPCACAPNNLSKHPFLCVTILLSVRQSVRLHGTEGTFGSMFPSTCLSTRPVQVPFSVSVHSPVHPPARVSVHLSARNP